MRSVIRSRRKNIGSENEHINDDPAYENFHFTTDEGRRVLDEHEIIDDDECEPTSPDAAPTAGTTTRSTPVETVDEGEGSVDSGHQEQTKTYGSDEVTITTHTTTSRRGLTTLYV